LVGAVQVTEAHELMLISDQGTLVRTRVAEVSQLGRNTQGVTLIRLPADETLVSVMRLDAEEDNGEEGGTDDIPPPAGGDRSGVVEPAPAEE
ncbi:MAG: DNA gyrase subunit A, partial [Xanthomonadaceae bacterium]|nr:DNA gyrase subunit A [Xanthomonadaceae bacterium]